ncbi:hypothetical protein PRK78_002379 [Emydomyces testavorans]|uniref:EKC/KEOPS complex subunit BUD32 n=1 Tax=Emydomyces testavorans TaxID=2070801 RepID=A0AAF0IHR0_9EURO|nr:hypothetical protein PRK78_002379 [Emydomyces testavorans]
MSFVNPLRWPIWSTLWRSVSRFVQGLIHLLYRPSIERDERLDEVAGAGGHTKPQSVRPSRSCKPSQYPTTVTYRHVHLKPNLEIPKPRPGEVIYIAKGQFLTRGGTAILELLPSGAVVKTASPNPFCPPEEEDCRRNMRLEAQIYQKIGDHPRVPKFIQWDPDTCSLTIDYMKNGNLRDYIRLNFDTLTYEHRFRWAKQAAEGLQLLHSIGVVHCDISPRNFLLDSSLNLRISDFAGASLCGSEPSAFAATRFRHPSCNWDVAPRFEDDIFGLGSLIYFIMTNNYPYEELPSDEVEKLYKHRDFPEVAHLACGAIIKQCWNQQLNAVQVYDSLKLIVPYSLLSS